MRSYLYSICIPYPDYMITGTDFSWQVPSHSFLFHLLLFSICFLTWCSSSITFSFAQQGLLGLRQVSFILFSLSMNECFYRQVFLNFPWSLYIQYSIGCLILVSIQCIFSLARANSHLVHIKYVTPSLCQYCQVAMTDQPFLSTVLSSVLCHLGHHAGGWNFCPSLRVVRLAPLPWLPTSDANVRQIKTLNPKPRVIRIRNIKRNS